MRKTFFALIMLAVMSLIFSPAFNSPPPISRIFAADTATTSPGGEKITSTPTPFILRKVKLFPGIFVGVFHINVTENETDAIPLANNWNIWSDNWVYDGTVTIKVSKAGSARADIVFSHADSNRQWTYQLYNDVIGLYCKHDSIYRGSVNIGPQSMTFDPQDGSFKIRGKLAGGMSTLGLLLDYFCKEDFPVIQTGIDQIEGDGTWIAGDIVFNIDAVDSDSVGSVNQNNCSATLWEEAARGSGNGVSFSQTCNWHVSRLPNKPGGWKQ